VLEFFQPKATMRKKAAWVQALGLHLSSANLCPRQCPEEKKPKWPSSEAGVPRFAYLPLRCPDPQWASGFGAELHKGGHGWCRSDFEPVSKCLCLCGGSHTLYDLVKEVVLATGRGTRAQAQALEQEVPSILL
jgi:hypothetical protein